MYFAEHFAEPGSASIPIHVVAKDMLDSWLEKQPPRIKSWVTMNEFKGKLGQVLKIPAEDGELSSVLFGWGDEKARRRSRFHLAPAAKALPEGVYRFESGLTPTELEESAYAWLVGNYHFDRYVSDERHATAMLAPEGLDAPRLEAIFAGEILTRDLINTPANDMGPDELEAVVCNLANQFDAEVEVTAGDDLLSRNFPMIHAVGRASDKTPRLLDLRWGNEGDPKVTLVGKGVCFDTGGLNLKPGSTMNLMKKDMGGAATALGLARIIMQRKLPYRLRVLIPAVENSVSAGAMRPGDILASRKGLSVEVNNTDAEGRLVLADALTLADEEKPDYMFCLATLTGAARVAMGPDIVPYYTDDDSLSHSLGRAGKKVGDPVWRMPLWAPYEKLIEPGIADLDNAPSGGQAGSITAALFLRRFVEHAGSFVHFDIYGWSNSDAPGRPKGAAFQGARTILEVLEQKAQA